MKFITRLLPLTLLAPVLVLAQGELTDVTSFFGNIIDFINGTLVPLVFAIAFLVFIWGVFQYFIAGGADEGKRDSGKQLMLWGIIAFVVMVSVWGIVNLLSEGFGLDDENINTIPNAPTTNI